VELGKMHRKCTCTVIFQTKKICRSGEFISGLPWVWGFPWGFPWVWVWYGYGDCDEFPWVLWVICGDLNTMQEQKKATGKRKGTH